MSSYKTDQHRLVHRGRTFHFVSYDAQPANPRTGEAAMAPMWCLMCAGKRLPALAHEPDQDQESVIAALTRWLEKNVL